MIRRYDSLIVQRIARLLIPLIQIFALYVFFHGHYSPGGGFQAGVLIGASLILKLLVGSVKEREEFSVKAEFVMATLGVLIFLGIGICALSSGGRFFDYGAIGALGKEIAMRRYWGILIAEGGVLMVVSMTLVVIFHVLAITPDEDEQP
ncbi:MAG: MnhB domain-containing protein [Candidatus Omnitrophota bacterium]|nr:MnhB domain-containing protein [Candidatus Omnitrophota bacterium]